MTDKADDEILAVQPYWIQVLYSLIEGAKAEEATTTAPSQKGGGK